MRRSAILGFSSCLAAAIAVLVAAPSEAQAGTYIGAGFDFGSPIDDTRGAAPLYGFGGQIGYRFNLGPVFIQPEVIGNFTIFPNDQIYGPQTSNVFRLGGGGRFGLSGMIQPQIYAHAAGGFFRIDDVQPAFDVGFALAFKLVPFFRFGVQVGYNVVTSGPGYSLFEGGNNVYTAPAPKWINYGFHVGFDI